MNDNDRQNLKRSLSIVSVHKPESWRAILDLLDQQIGKSNVVSLMNLSLVEVFTNLTIGDIAALAEGAPE